METSRWQRARRRLECRFYLDWAAKDECLLINGLGRSGTTWLGGMLQNLAHCRSIFEPFFPRYVSASQPLGYFPYIDTAGGSVEQIESARRVLRGDIRNRWVDRDNRPACYRRRLIKEIRASYILPWLKRIYPGLKVILLVRDPYAVYHSWEKLGWLENRKRSKEIFALHNLIENDAFVQRFPDWAEYGRHIYPDVGAEAFFFDWFTSILIPLVELESETYYVMSYEDLRTDPVSNMQDLLKWAALTPPSRENLVLAARRSSSTAFSFNQLKSAQAIPVPEKSQKVAEQAAQFFLGLGMDEVRVEPLSVLRQRADTLRIEAVC